ncbi:molybdate ABC transporter substrate-binding protein [Thermaurantiacus tibetensis]|uniref:molybdate ABC transporter substrate-binding protein n=1 Tax=Thermaurantiacus tibetensis TaxID=2759035 RepID=UPI0018908D47|nr:molybdate ABC transporter substrate-binding protein [Thermaurantiacus tibetensis]
MLARRSALLGLAALAAAPAFAQRASGPPVAAAADLQAAMPELVAAFTRRTGASVRVTLGSSGSFAQQILAGAPFELFLSADEGFIAKLHAAGRTLDEGRLYAIGRIGHAQPLGSPVRVDPELAGLAEALKGDRIRRFAIANPVHAPYGRAAREALTRAGLWAAVEPRLVLGENAAQATQFAVSGAAQGGIIPLSLARAPAIAPKIRFALIPADWHAELRQRMALMKGAGATARAFHDFLGQAEAHAILRRYGFVLPGESP